MLEFKTFYTWPHLEFQTFFTLDHLEFQLLLEFQTHEHLEGVGIPDFFFRNCFRIPAFCFCFYVNSPWNSRHFCQTCFGIPSFLWKKKKTLYGGGKGRILSGIAQLRVLTSLFTICQYFSQNIINHQGSRLITTHGYFVLNGAFFDSGLLAV